jgi:hypothetical protein
MIATFVRLTLMIALACVAVLAFLVLVKIVFFAAILAAVVLGSLFLVNFLRAFAKARFSRMTS